MNRIISAVITASALIFGVFLPREEALAQAAKDLVGTWTLVSVSFERPDSSKGDVFGPNPLGILLFDAAGRVLFISLALVSSGGTATSQQASGSPAKPTPASTPIPLAKVPLEAQSALASLQEIDANVSGDQSSADGIGRTLSILTNEIDVRVGDDTSLLRTSPSLDMLYWLKRTWEDFGVRWYPLAS
jgi:hypothetical protein